MKRRIAKKDQTLKADLIHGNSFKSEKKLDYSITEYINHFYYRKDFIQVLIV